MQKFCLEMYDLQVFITNFASSAAVSVCCLVFLLLLLCIVLLLLLFLWIRPVASGFFYCSLFQSTMYFRLAKEDKAFIDLINFQ